MISYKQAQAVQNILKVNCNKEIPLTTVYEIYTPQDVTKLMNQYPAEKFGYYAIREKVMAERSNNGNN